MTDDDFARALDLTAEEEAIVALLEAMRVLRERVRASAAENAVGLPRQWAALADARAETAAALRPAMDGVERLRAKHVYPGEESSIDLADALDRGPRDDHRRLYLRVLARVVEPWVKTWPRRQPANPLTKEWREPAPRGRRPVTRVPELKGRHREAVAYVLRMHMGADAAAALARLDAAKLNAEERKKLGNKSHTAWAIGKLLGWSPSLIANEISPHRRPRRSGG